MKVALVQMMVVADKEENLRHATELVKEAASGGTDFVVLPEIFCCEYRNSAFRKNCEPKGGLIYTSLQKMAKDNGVYLVGGTFPEQDGDKIYNTCYVFNRNGEEIGRHRKMHLFNIDIKGKQRFCESDTLTGGDEVTVIDTEFGKIGVEVCFDIRFPELTRLMAIKGAEVIFCPASFNMNTGPRHWEIMFRARAVENQLYMIGCAPAQNKDSSYLSFGHSLVVDAWSDTKAMAEFDECIVRYELDFSVNNDVREQIPQMSARRCDVYTLSEN